MYRIISALSIFLMLTSCEPAIDGNGKVASETRETAGFHSIDLDGEYEVVISPANYSSMTIEADENLLPYIETHVNKGVLYVSSKRNIGRYRKLALVLNMKEFRSIAASGGVEIRSTGVLISEKMSLELSGASDVKLQLEVDELEAEVSGAAEIELVGNADQAEVEVSGAVELNAADFKTRNFKLEMSGAGEAEVYVTEKLDVEVSGAAALRYRGEPAEINRKVSGAASIEPM